jgi:hypothetical protein
MGKKVTVAQRRRLARRAALWPDSHKLIYDKREESGFCTVPRTLSLVGTLIKHLSARVDPSKAYWDLWLRQRDDGFVEVEDQEEMAASCGYVRPPRNVRTWREAIDELERLGFIKVAGKGTRKYAFILLHHPHDVVQWMRDTKPNSIPDWWWSLFENRVMDIGAKLRWTPPKAATKAALFEDFPEALDAEDDDLPF